MVGSTQYALKLQQQCLPQQTLIVPRTAQYCGIICRTGYKATTNRGCICLQVADSLAHQSPVQHRSYVAVLAVKRNRPRLRARVRSGQSPARTLCSTLREGTVLRTLSIHIVGRHGMLQLRIRHGFQKALLWGKLASGCLQVDDRQIFKFCCATHAMFKLSRLMYKLCTQAARQSRKNRSAMQFIAGAIVNHSTSSRFCNPVSRLD